MKPDRTLADFSANVVDAIRALEAGRVALAMGHLRQLTDDLDAGLAGLKTMMETREREESLLGLLLKRQDQALDLAAKAVERAEARIAAAVEAEARVRRLGSGL